MIRVVYKRISTGIDCKVSSLTLFRELDFREHPAKRLPLNPFEQIMPCPRLVCLFVLAMTAPGLVIAQNVVPAANPIVDPTISSRSTAEPSSATGSVPVIDASPPVLRAEDELWLVSSRRMCARSQGVESLDVWKEINEQWVASSAAEFVAPDAYGFARPVVILVHGNDWSLQKAIKRGHQTYHRSMQRWTDRPPIRFVIWTWPSDKIAGPIRNVRIKADVADAHSSYLAKFLQNMSAHPNVSLVGFSYGARVVLGALDLLGGGCVDGGRLPMITASLELNVTLIAPAIRNDALTTTRSRAYSQMKSLFIMYNSHDRYLSLYRWTKFDGRQPALGYTGLTSYAGLPESSLRIEQYNASQNVGPQHDYLEYISDAQVERRLRANLLTNPAVR